MYGNHSGNHAKIAVKPSQWRTMAQHIVVTKNISIRLASAVFGLSESGSRYIAKLKDENKRIAYWLTNLIPRNNTVAR